MQSAVLLYTSRCNIRCAHCSVDSHPTRTEKMSLERALDIVRGLCAIPELHYIDISGGEPMLYRREIAVLASAVGEGGKRMRIVTNGFWARNVDEAAAILQEMRAAGVSSVGVSIDEWHREFLPASLIHNYIAASRRVGHLPLLSIVVRSLGGPPVAGRIPAGVSAGLAQYGIAAADCLDSYEWGVRMDGESPERREALERDLSREKILLNWQLLTSEGRARDLDVDMVPLAATPQEPCSMAGHLPTIDEQGRLFPCCSPWTSRKTHALAEIDGDNVAPAIERLLREPLIRIIHDYGPKRLIEAARLRGIDFPEVHSGICNQCGLLMDRLTLAQLRELAADIVDGGRDTRCLQILGIRERPLALTPGVSAPLET